jgi:hypothetical protein
MTLRKLLDSMDPIEAFDTYLTFLSTMSTRDAILPYSTNTVSLMISELSHLESRLAMYDNFLPDINNVIRKTEQALKESYLVMDRREARRRDSK